MKNKLIVAALAILSMVSVNAIVIDNPLSLQKPFLVGILNGQPSNSNVATETVIAQKILNLSLGETDGDYQANTIFNFGGTITSNGGQHEEAGDFGDADDSVSIEAGWRWVLAKYDGQNAGYVLFALGNQAEYDS